LSPSHVFDSQSFGISKEERLLFLNKLDLSILTSNFRYFHFDAEFVMTLIGMKVKALSSKKEIEKISKKTKIEYNSCKRQVSNTEKKLIYYA
jgi:hypothetical protein